MNGQTSLPVRPGLTFSSGNPSSEGKAHRKKADEGQRVSAAFEDRNEKGRPLASLFHLRKAEAISRNSAGVSCSPQRYDRYSSRWSGSVHPSPPGYFHPGPAPTSRLPGTSPAERWDPRAPVIKKHYTRLAQGTHVDGFPSRRGWMTEAGTSPPELVPEKRIFQSTPHGPWRELCAVRQP